MPEHAPPESKEAKFTPTTKQWRYLEELKRQVESGQILSQAETARRIGCRAPTISIWNRSDRFREQITRILYRHNDPLVPLLQRALLWRGICGSVKHAELALRTRGLLDVEPSEGIGAPGTTAAAAVTFIGLPEPLTAAQASAMRPPQASNVVYRPVLSPEFDFGVSVGANRK